MFAFLEDQVENVISELDSVMHDDIVLKLMLYTLVKENKYRGIQNVMKVEDMEKKLIDLSKVLLDDINALNYLITEFNFDKFLDLLRLLSPPKLLTPEHFDLILALFKSKKRKTFFKESRPPGFGDVELFITRFSQLKEHFTVEKETEVYMREVARILL
jgi:hypothetical protein